MRAIGQAEAPRSSPAHNVPCVKQRDALIFGEYRGFQASQQVRLTTKPKNYVVLPKHSYS
jgi:hypothetical protein